MENQINALQRQLNTMPQTQQEQQGLQRNYAATLIKLRQQTGSAPPFRKGQAETTGKPSTRAKFSSTYQPLWQL